MQKLKSLLQRFKKKNDQKGFTLIEIVIVLAIAGLIFVIVFLAVGAAQAARRDTQRRNAASQLLAAANSYSGNNNGNIPADGWCGNSGGTASAAPTTYWTPGNDPSGNAYVCVATAITGGSGTVGNVHFEAAGTCGTGGSVNTTGANPRQYAVQIVLERGGAVCDEGG